MTIFYRILQIMVGLGFAVLLWFFVVGIGDSSISSDNILVWSVLLIVPVAAVLLAHGLWARGQRAAAVILLLIPAVPVFLYGLYVAMILLIAPDFR